MKRSSAALRLLLLRPLLHSFWATAPAGGAAPLPCPGAWPDINQTAPDLAVPHPMPIGTPAAAGRRVLGRLPGWGGSVRHALYLPADWSPSRRWPVLFDLAGNGPFADSIGDSCDGMVESQSFGFGASGGRGWIWVAAPYISANRSANQHQWWGDPPGYAVEPTLEYHAQLVAELVDRWGADPAKIVLTGFSRGALAVNYIGLYNQQMASLWAGSIAYGHYDGRPSDQWVPYPLHDPASALTRLGRLAGRPQFVCEKMCGVNATRYHRGPLG